MPASHTPGRLRPPTRPPDRAAPQCRSFRAAATPPGPTLPYVNALIYLLYQVAIWETFENYLGFRV